MAPPAARPRTAVTPRPALAAVAGSSEPDRPAAGITSGMTVTVPPGAGVELAAAGRPVTRRRTWLDTSAGRLSGAGLPREQATGRAPAELRLTGRDGALLAAEPLGR